MARMFTITMTAARTSRATKHTNGSRPRALRQKPTSRAIRQSSIFPAVHHSVTSGDACSDDQLIRRDIERAVDEQLAQKGLNKVEKNGDLVVTYHVGVREEKSVSLFGSGWKAGGTGWWDGSVQGQSSTIPIGTLVVDVYDSARKQLIWRGYASKTIDLKKDPDKNYKNLQRAMAKLFKNYPPQTVK